MEHRFALFFLLWACRDEEGAYADDTEEETAPPDSSDSEAPDTEDSDGDNDTETGGTDTDDTGEWVNPCIEGTIHIDDDSYAWPSIQSALDVIQDGSVLHVCPGTHYESLALVRPNGGQIEGKIYIVGNSADDTIIVGQGNDPVVLTYTDVEISNLTLREGSGYDVNVAGGDSEPIWVSMGGGIYMMYADLVLDHVVIESNAADIGGGLYVHGGYPTILLNSCSIKNNLARGGSPEHGEPYGGGIFLEGFSYRLESYDTDWGEGDEDNEPEDFSYSGPGYSGTNLEFTIPPGASFICDSKSKGEICQILE